MDIEGIDPTIVMDPESLKRQKPIKRLLTPLLTKSVPPLPTPEQKKKMPLRSWNPLSRFFFSWLIPMLNVGYKRTLLQQDLWYLDEKDAVEHNYNQIQLHLRSALDKHYSKNPESKKWPRFILAKAVFRTYSTEFFFALLFRVLSDATNAMIPYLARYLIDFIEKKSALESTSPKEGIGYAIGLTLMLILNGILNNQSFLIAKLIGAKAKIALNKALLEQSLIVDNATKYKFPNGKVVSLMNADLDRIDLALGFLPLLLGFPVPLIIGIGILVHNIGVSALTGVAIIFVMIICMGGPAAAIMPLRTRANKYTDERISMTRELLLNMRMVKFYSWEDAYERMITTVRSTEVTFVLKIQIIMAVIFSVAIAAPSVVSMVSFLVLDKIGTGSPATIFSSLSLFNMLSNTIVNIPVVLGFIVDAITASKRITEYLQASVIDPNEKKDFYDNDLIADDDKTAIKIANATFEWDIFKEVDDVESSIKGETSSDSEKIHREEGFSAKSKEDDPGREIVHDSLKVLSNVNLEIKKGEFIVITGSIGVGKTSLLAAIFGLMEKTKGSVAVNGTMIFSGEPWVQNATVRENITFGSPYDEKYYQKVIKACCLNLDLESFSAGDQTEIGERGVTLSGGQKARLNLARAVYSNKDIYLLDDILSAVDANVGNHITENCLLGLISDKTRLLATHQLSLITKADKIIFVKNNGTADFGTEQELRDRDPEFVQLMEFNRHSKEDQEDESDEELKSGQISRKQTEIEENQRIFKIDDGVLVADEERAVNSIPLHIYRKYIQSGEGALGSFALPLLVLLMALAVFTSLFSNVWLSFWIGNKFQSLNNDTYIGLYILFTFLTVVFVCLEFAVFGYMIVNASKTLNIAAMQRIIHTPMQFIDTTPLGRILNRFATDTNVLDNEIDTSLKLFTHLSASAIGILILAIIYIPYFAIAIPVLLILFFTITNYYQSSAREVKRLEAINKSFILNNFNEVLNGINTIKAYDQQHRFVAKNNRFSDSMNEVYFVVIANQRWISVNLDTLASIVVLIVTLLTVTGQFNLSPSSAGLLTSYMIDFAMLLSAILVFYAELENNMNSVERVCHYAYEVVQEKLYRIPETKPGPEWPSKGTIEFKNSSLRYRDDLPLIFNNLSLKIDGGQKVGICGRTGAGKSSLMGALYRINELESGSIEIDGIDISRLGLFDLRSKLSIIPQDPVLFKGTIRKNLDPFDEHEDAKLWDALRRSGVFTNSDFAKVKEEATDGENNLNKFHLYALVSEDGSNFSLGEKQLIALARALVRDTKILVMDEATSSVDYETDALIQKTISTEFSQCTVLCIAHRLRTILKNDKIVVMDDGELEEFGTPIELYENDGIFHEMCVSSGINRSDFDV